MERRICLGECQVLPLKVCELRPWFHYGPALRHRGLTHLVLLTSWVTSSMHAGHHYDLIVIR
jgi:hypothetical protein